jgi:4-amino-4-deoxy-L-arabinose transferase-like glycosyltransferase
LPRREGLLLTGLAVLAFVLRFARWERAAVLFNDGPVFLALAERSAQGALEVLLQHPFHPLYPLAIAAVHAFGAPFGLSFETAGALVAALAGSAGVLAIYALVRAAFGPREALVAAALLAIHAAAVDVGGDVQSESLYLALFLGSAAALWNATTDGRASAGLLAGTLSGLAYLTRPEGIGLALVGVALAGWRALRGHLPLARAVRVGLAVALGAGLFAAPYVAALSIKSGELTLTRKKSVGWIVGTEGHKGSGGLPTGQAGMEAPKIPREQLVAELGPIPEPPPPHEATPGASSGAAARPDPTDSLVAPPWTARAAPAAFFDLLDDAISALRPEILPLVLLGLFALRGRPSRRAGFFAAVCGAYGLLLFALAMNVGYVSERHLLPVVLLLLGYGAAGTLWAAERLAGLRGAAPTPARTRAVAAAILAVVLLVSLGKTLRRPEGIEDLAERRAAEWVREQAPGSVVAARKRRVAYYAGGPFLQLRPRTPFSFELYFTNHRVRYVVVNQVDVAEYVGLDDLIGTRLQEVHRVEEAGETALVYAVLPRPAESPAVSAAGENR